MTGVEDPSELRRLPQVDRLASLIPGDAPQPLKVSAARAALAQARGRVMGGDPAANASDLAAQAASLLRAGERSLLTRVINATGVLLHTNLGRSPLGPDALASSTRIGAAYSNLEFDLASGGRGSRYDHSAELLRELTGAEAALVVNNNAAAVMLALHALARGREVVVSRGELIEIGGEFRLPEIMEVSGAKLVEVGTTNRTHLRDYRKAMSAETGAVLKVHPSNYSLQGFTKDVPGRELALLAHENGVPLIHDLGSGLLRRRIAGAEQAWLSTEPAVTDALEDGADLVTFSGDKLLGGPQAGIIVGRVAAIESLRSSPMLRAVRVDKTTLAALASTLLSYLRGTEGELPFWKMALLTADEIRARAKVIADAIRPDAQVELIEGLSTAGGGAGPESNLPTVLIEIEPPTESETLTRALLDGDPPVVGRIQTGRVLLDLRTVVPADDAALISAVKAALTLEG